MTVPKPSICRALLFSESAGRPTWHRYVATMECQTPKTITKLGEKLGGPGWEFLFECEVTGVQKRWGVEDRKANRFDEPEGN